LLKRNFKNLALSIFSKVIANSKKKNEVREKIIDICLENGESDYPLGLLDLCIKENPKNYEMVFKAGVIHRDEGDWEKALKYFTKVDKHVRGHVDAKFQIANIYYRNRKILIADDYLNQILRINPRHEEAIALRREL